eukprot:CAMPEP_0118991390 /NCGR_PEP_ID=MMETSP1173-20130426/51565_1 /TAXON_ID=1034831 /ORGANISM="Rhizochromulina marina cf, Strain CCMP1243" /LENGTH=99 /DNA_ID=CAMNT_0006942511 /DNA_START=295 /DNA_END=594 /DNA_ORIENTATION=-
MEACTALSLSSAACKLFTVALTWTLSPYPSLRPSGLRESSNVRVREAHSAESQDARADACIPSSWLSTILARGMEMAWRSASGCGDGASRWRSSSRTTK